MRRDNMLHSLFSSAVVIYFITFFATADWWHSSVSAVSQAEDRYLSQPGRKGFSYRAAHSVQKQNVTEVGCSLPLTLRRGRRQLRAGDRDNRISAQSWQRCSQKLIVQIHGMNRDDAPFDERFIVVYHVGDIGLASNSIDVAVNNIKLFASAIEKHSDRSPIRAFYLFNVVGGDRNPLARFIPADRSNVAVLEWSHATSDMDAHIRTMHVLAHNAMGNYSATMFINQGVRGPLVLREEGKWLQEYKSLLSRQGVAMVGSTLSCEVSPHVQTHLFALKSAVIPMIIRETKSTAIKNQMRWRDMIAQLEVGMSVIIRKAGYNIAALLYDRRGYPVFKDGNCLRNTGAKTRFELNPTSWCDVEMNEVIFMKWGGEAMRTQGFMCNSSLSRMEEYMYILNREEPELELIVPEVLMGGAYYDLFKEYEMERKRDRFNTKASYSDLQSNQKVCFAVRVHGVNQDSVQENSHTPLMNKDLELLLTSLQRQTNQNWLAYLFFIDQTDHLEEPVKQLLQHFDDPRVHYLPTSPEVRPPYSGADGAALVTDYVLRHVLLPKMDCEYISVTVSDNAYGSNVVQSVLSHGIVESASSAVRRTTRESSKLSEQQKKHKDRFGEDMILVPMDSRRFAEQDRIFRRRLPLIAANVTYEDYCTGIDAMLRYMQYSYIVRPVPAVGRVDLSAVFLKRSLWLTENLLLSNFSDQETYPCYSKMDPTAFPCLGSAGAHLVEYLARHSLWSYRRLPLDGLRSLVFHGNSPTLCIASGNVWLDHFQLHRQTCLTHKEVLHITDKPQVNYLYDFQYFLSHGEILGSCLRMRDVAFRSNYYNKDWVPLEKWKPLPNFVPNYRPECYKRPNISYC